MKKIIAFFVSVMLLLALAAPALAATPDLTFVKANPDVFSLTTSEDGEDLYVSTVLTAKNLHFVHKYESNYYWSFTRFEIAVPDYQTDEAAPLWQLWITYSNDLKIMEIDSVTFIVNGRSFTFSGISDPRLQTQKENGFIEEMMICFGSEGLDFLLAMEEYCGTLNDANDFRCTMILHGSEDITVTLGGAFVLDFLSTRQAYMEMGVNTLQAMPGTPMTAR